MWSAFYDKIMYLLFSRSLRASAAAKTCSAFLSLHFVGERKQANVDPRKIIYGVLKFMFQRMKERERMYYMMVKLKPKNKRMNGKIDKMKLPLWATWLHVKSKAGAHSAIKNFTLLCLIKWSLYIHWSLYSLRHFKCILVNEEFSIHRDQIFF